MEKIYLSDVIGDSIEFIDSSMYDIDDICDIYGVDLSNITGILPNIRDPETGEQYDRGFTIKLGKPLIGENDTAANEVAVASQDEANSVMILFKAATGRVAYRVIGKTNQVSFVAGFGYSNPEDRKKSSSLISYNVFAQKSGVGYRIQRKKRDQETTYTVYVADENSVNDRRRVASYSGRILQFSGITAWMQKFLENPEACLQNAKIAAMRDKEIKDARSKRSRGSFRKPH